MTEVQEVEMARERGDVMIDIDATAEISEEKISEITTTITKDEVAQDNLQALMQQRLDAVPGEPLKSRPITIFRVPTWFHEADKKLFEPQVVSIGPYHRGKGEFRAMEEHKWSFLRDFQARNKEVGLDVYIEEIRALETRARLCYSETVDLGSDEFVMMLVLDGCFILEYFLKQKFDQLDALVNATWAEGGVDTDILLLENQIPFFVTHKLFAIHGDCDHHCKGHCPLPKLIIKFLSYLHTYKRMSMPPQPACNDIHHLLHLYHTCVVPDLQIEDNNNLVRNRSCSLGTGIFSWFKSWFIPQSSFAASERAEEEEEDTEEEGEAEDENSSTFERFAIIPCVSELHEAGVTFKRKKRPLHMFDLSFEKGVMEMPFMEIDANQKIIFTNVVAFEQSQINLPEIFTSYLALMDALVNTAKDVALLQKCGILENLLQNEEDAAVFFNHFGDFNSMDYDDHYFRGLFIKVRKYSESTWHKYRAKLMHDYFNNPWTIISVGAAGVLLILTVVQTYYTVYSSIHN